MDTDKNNISKQRDIVLASLADLNKAKSELDKLRLERDKLNLQTNKALIRMPFDGYLFPSDSSFKQGSIVNVGDTYALVAKNKNLVGQLLLPEALLDQVKIKQAVSIKLYGYNKDISGIVESISPSTEIDLSAATVNTASDSGDNTTSVKANATRVSRVMISIKHDETASLMPGMTGWAKVQGEWLPLVNVFTRSLLRFFRIDVWSWLP